MGATVHNKAVGESKNRGIDTMIEGEPRPWQAFFSDSSSILDLDEVFSNGAKLVLNLVE
jgi:hypothetical protein